MPPVNFCLVLVFVLVLLSVFSFTSLADPIYWHHFCSNVSGNSAFMANRNNLVSNLSTNATTRHDGFYNTTTGQRPNVVYGLFLCRGDLIPENCQNCINLVAADLARRCLNSTWGIIWYDQCMLRYSSNHSIFSSMAVMTNKTLVDHYITVMKPDRFSQLRGILTKDVATRASNASLGAKKFATAEATVTKFQKLYSLAQCTPDISGEDCYSCLEKAIAGLKHCCSKKPALALYPSCTVQYRITPFYQLSNRTADAPPPPALSPPKKTSSSDRLIKNVVPAISFLVFSSFICCALGCWRARKKTIARKKHNDGSKAGAVESLRFEMSTIEAATNNFAQVNKIGAGGFGSVYKGALPCGQEIAVKRLSSGSGQGSEEFRNEVSIVAKLQHRNLVKLFGYCLERNDRMLVYEFVPNKSLDHFIFDSEKQRQLNWPQRYKIIKGIARGLLYLHSDSHLKIIHRDLKPNEDMTPKISDFGMAKTIAEDQSQERTKRIVGTYGYMSPEYALRGRFSEKSDVFSFGILMLEIVSGKMNTSFCHSEYTGNLETYAWRHWKGDRPLELMDSTLQDSFVSNEVLRCIQIGLLCVQENADARPTMARVALMLTSSSVSLPLPQKTAFFFGSVTGRPMLSVVDEKQSDASSASMNDASITEPFPR